MPKAVDLSTAGIKVGYGIEETAGTKPTKFINIPNPKSIPDTNPEPSTYDVTSLNDTTWKRYIQGLKDIGGALAITFGMSQVFLDSWDDQWMVMNVFTESDFRKENLMEVFTQSYKGQYSPLVELNYK